MDLNGRARRLDDGRHGASDARINLRTTQRARQRRRKGEKAASLREAAPSEFHRSHAIVRNNLRLSSGEVETESTIRVFFDPREEGAA